MKTRPNALTLLVVAALAALPVSPAAAQSAPNDSGSAPAVAPVARPGTRPGVLSRPTAPTPSADEGSGDAAGQPAPEAAAQNPPATQQQGASTAPVQQNAAPARTGPPVLEVQDVAPDVGEIGGNFVEEWDPLNPPSNVLVNIDFNQADLSDVVMWISALTGRNFIIADTISASKKITIISPRPVSIAEAYRAFLAALNMNGLTVVPFGSFLKIVEAEGAVRENLEPTDSISEVPNDDRMVTHIHQLDHVAIDQVQPVLDAMKTSAAQIIAYEPTNTLIITETGSNLRRLLDMLERLDVPSGQEQINLYRVQYADAEELGSLLLEIFQQDEGAAPAETPRVRRRSAARANDEGDEPANDTTSVEADGTNPAAVSVSQIIPDPRTNQLIIIANERSFEQIMSLTQRLDVPIPGEGQVHVMFLENADATEIASTLQSLTQSVEQMREEAGGQAAADGAVDPATATFTGELSITADEATNSLVVVGSLRDFLALQNVVRQLDRRRQQVYVEAMIMEITVNRNSEFGVAFNGGALPSIEGEDAPVFGGTRVGDLTSLTLDPSSLMGLAVGLRGPSIPGSEDALGISIPSFGAILQAMQTDNDVNVLSTPHILTLDNEEAEIVVGENIPFISGVSGGLGGSGGLGNLAGLVGGDSGASDLLGSLGGLSGLSGLGGLGGAVSVQRQDVALTLRITPQINESNFVRLEIEEEVEDVQSIDPVLGPRTTTRQLSATVVVQDQQTVVLGGLLRDTQIRDVNKVPVLGDIPIIGHLFRQTVNRTAKTNLLLLLTPYIIRDPADFRTIFERKMEEREEFLAYFGRHDSEYHRSLDYARKDGPMQAMFETISAAVADAEARREAFSGATEETPLDAAAPVRIDYDGGTAPSAEPIAPVSAPAPAPPVEAAPASASEPTAAP